MPTENSAEVERELMQEEADRMSEGTRTHAEALRLRKTDPRLPPQNYYEMRLMVGTYTSFLFSGFGHRCPLYINGLALYRTLDHEVMQEHTEKFTRSKCAQLTWQLLEESRFFFRQRLIADDFENGGPYAYPMSKMGSLLDEVRRHKNLLVDTLPRQWLFE